MPVIIGCPRSGTTLLRLMLDAHPELAIPPETGFLPTVAGLRADEDALRRVFFETVTAFPPDAPAWPDFHVSDELLWQALKSIHPFSSGEGCRAFYRLYAHGKNKPRWGDKTPHYCFHIERIRELLPEAHFVHIIRDGRDVAVSLRLQWFAPGKDMESLARHWRDCIETARRQAKGCNRYIEVRFEDLVSKPREVLERICHFLQMPFHTTMEQHHRFASERLREHLPRRRTDGTVLVSREQRLDQQRMSQLPPDRERVGCWKTGLLSSEARAFHEAAGELLEELGYF